MKRKNPILYFAPNLGGELLNFRMWFKYGLKDQELFTLHLMP